MNPNFIQELTHTQLEAKQLADAIVHDYGDHNDLVSGFATLGGHKKSLRDYARWIQKLTPQLKCKSIPLRLKNVGKHGTCERPHLVLCPHNVIAVAHDNLPEDVFARLFLGAPGEIHEY